MIYQFCQQRTKKETRYLLLKWYLGVDMCPFFKVASITGVAVPPNPIVQSICQCLYYIVQSEDLLLKALQIDIVMALLLVNS